uniref:Anaphase-promoting complex subunit 13 n=1 Tax=Grammatophora oceanica TaxID=210454 RepID=A0A7S1Y257_9STRA|mmetsp:Transcript_11852/g.17412  ORF Transcript_11852/g.17412 Transcript_11852/m.17412 type:complete len:147 (+) Transcript_11852:72-512(+)|eukprot:CAMPEP_0194034120 /NCGR_PEP_ID=MMETSP0009_2-20130614/6528_1 /TAXON_ID=210454 /ORGANISM="Grammatophora oceanica, Strain CCMP 410" /LENGTH=146 /DNA_ID=CAMNT_0038674889 /DNA_START=68 /DNA_END=508 /DNA_ORIENTATION=-
MSDSNYLAITRHRAPFAKWSEGRPRVVLDAMISDSDHRFADAASLSDDEIDTARHEIPLMGEDDDLEPDAAVVSTGTSATAATNAEQRQRREEGWNDLALDQIDDRGSGVMMSTMELSNTAAEAANNGAQQQQQSGGNQGGGNGSN